MWPFKRTLSERYSKLVKLIKSIDSHFQLTEDKEDSLRLHLPNYKGNQPMDFHIYMMEPFLFISFVTEIEGEKISCVNNFPKDTDQQDMFNVAMSNNLNKIHQVLEDKYSEDGEEKKDDGKEETDGNHNSVTSNNDSSDETWGLRDYYDFNESFKKHALTIMILRRGIEFRYFASKNDYTPKWSYNIDWEKIQSYNCPSGAEPLVWIMKHYDNREDFCWLLEVLDEQIAHLWVESMEEPEKLIEDIQKYVPQFKLKNNPQDVKVNLGWSWIDIHAILHFIDYCSYQQNKLLSTPEEVKPLQECTTIEDISRLYWSNYTKEPHSQKENNKEEYLEDIVSDSIVVQSWSLLDFAKTHGKMKRVPSSSHINSETGEEELSAAYCVFVHPTNKDEQGKPVITAIVAFSSELGELTAKEIGEQKDDLIVVEYESGNYSLKRKELEIKENHSTEVTKMDNIANKIDNIEMIFCKYCGKRIEANSKFCIYCGKQLQQEVFVLKDFPNNIISAIPVNSQEDLDEIISIGNENLVSGNYEKAYFFLREAARFGDAQSAFNTGLLLFHGNGVEKNEERAITFFMQAAEKDFIQAYNSIGVCFALGRGVPKDMSKAVSWYQKGADKGDKLAQNSLGRCYLIGDGVEKNLELGIYWTKKSAEQGYNGSLFNLGYCYETGLRVNKDLSKAIHYYKEALEKGYHQAGERLKKLQDN